MKNQDKPDKPLYKGKYLIAAYDDEDFPFGVWYNAQEMAKDTGISGPCIHCLLCRIKSGKQGSAKIAGRRCRIYFIPWKERKTCRSKTTSKTN